VEEALTRTLSAGFAKGKEDTEKEK